MATNLLKSQLKGPKKNFYANRELLNGLLSFMNENRGKGSELDKNVMMAFAKSRFKQNRQ